ncbi:MAG: urease accessory protein UreF [Limisphaerales bacterium]
MKTAHDDWLLWQLADSAFPTGGFAHSGGLEAAWQHGEVRSAAELKSFLKASLSQLAHGALPFVNAAHNAPEEALELDGLCDAFLANHVANRASRVQGQSLLIVAEKAFGLARPPLPFAHLAPVFGCVARRLQLTAASAAHLFLYQNVRGLMAAAIRLGIVGPMEAQALQHELAPCARETADLCESLPLAELSQTAPLLDLWQASQDRLYSRLFQS